MSTWVENAISNLLSRSRSNDLATAMKEWNTTGGYEDTHTIAEICELCEHEGLRYQFEIANPFTGNRLWVGSTCITKFIPLFENGIEVLNEAAKAALLKKRQTEYEATSREQKAISLLEALEEIDSTVFGHPNWQKKWKLGYGNKKGPVKTGPYLI